MPYSLRMSATRSTSPVEEAKKATRLPASTSVRASAIATCMLPWNASEGRVAMCRWLPLGVAAQPISSSLKIELRAAPAACCLQIFPAEVNLLRVVGRRALDLLQPLPEAARRRRAPAPARPRPRSGRSSSEKTDACRCAAPWAPAAPSPERARRGPADRGRACRPRASARPARSSSCARFLIFRQR